ncbi:MAG: 5-(carboxyamino)imidazole ribonucleotide mutase [Gammaproteobacteria bacterium RIFCSPHIGHO2_12_FULL_45_9]|nr:MAG: 5-(carboxyamino)imidazole ribonucleotide mutase [Gammaproteobacteria bacterium RIFCSPHIGHO2_12_FULL_45_9]
MKQSSIFVAILMGSQSDLSVMESTAAVLKSLAIPYEMRVWSAHRTPDLTREYIQSAEARGCGVFIAAAGLAAHLAGAVAAHTVRPVIGVPLAAGALNGLDALLSTVQMPGGVPVATVAIGKPGAENAGYLAAQILSVSNLELATRLRSLRAVRQAEMEAFNQTLEA